MPNDNNLHHLVGRKKKKKGFNAPTNDPCWSAMTTSNPFYSDVDINSTNTFVTQPTDAVPQKALLNTQQEPVKQNTGNASSSVSMQNALPSLKWELSSEQPKEPKWEPKGPLMPTPSVPRLQMPQMPSVQSVRAPLIKNLPVMKPKAPLLPNPSMRPQLPQLRTIGPITKARSMQMKKLTNFMNLQIQEMTQRIEKGKGKAAASQNFPAASTSTASVRPQLISSAPKTTAPNPQSNHVTASVVSAKPSASTAPGPQSNPVPTSAAVTRPPSSNVPGFQSNPQAPTGMANFRATLMNTGGLMRMNVNMYPPGYPKGVPKSFLIAQSQETSNPNTPSGMPVWPTVESHSSGTNKQIFVQTDDQPETVQQPYSPSDVYAESSVGDAQEDLESPDKNPTGQKRLSAFHRLGPISQPKKTKLTINLNFNKEQPVREVIDETEEATEKYTPVHIRQDILTSTDEVVMKYLMYWPWKKHLTPRKSVTARNSKSVMILEQEQMEEIYEKSNTFIQLSIKGYPKSWNKEDVLDAVFDAVKGKPMIPCFIEFSEQECKFLVLRSRSALVSIHKLGFLIRKGDVDLKVVISTTDLSLSHLEFIPRIVLRKRIASAFDGEGKLNLSAFTLAPDISHFIYFPLSRLTNQTELMHMQSIAWEDVTELDLSHNKLTSITGFDLTKMTPKLKRLNLSSNYIDKLTSLLSVRALSLNAIWLDGNPLCHDYTDPDHYVKVIRMIFPCVREIDGVKITLKGDMPPFQKNYCPPDAAPVVDRFLDIYFALMDAPVDQKQAVQNLYDEDATMTITYGRKLRNMPMCKSFRNLFLRARDLAEGDMETVKGAASVASLINKWPDCEHDPFTFTADVLHHDDDSTIIRVGGVLKLNAESLADDEQLIAFARTFVLRTNDGVEYRIVNELVHWDKVPEDVAQTAFRKTTVKSTKLLSPKLESPPDEELKEELIKIFMKLTTLDKKASVKCLEDKDWHITHALEYFAKLLRLDEIGTLTGNIN